MSRSYFAGGRVGQVDESGIAPSAEECQLNEVDSIAMINPCGDRQGKSSAENGARTLSKTKRRKVKAKAASKGATVHAVKESLRRHLPSEALRLAQELAAKAPSAEHRALLGEAIIARLATMLHGQLDASLAQRLVDELDRLGADLAVPEHSPLKTEAQRFRVLLCDTAVDSEAAPELVNALVDLALRNSDLLTRLPPAIAEETRAVATGLAKIEQGDDEAALTAVAAIGYRSPLAPWRMFIRGLVHYYNGAMEQAADLWKRLPGDRPPRRIAWVLLGLQSRTLGDDPLPSEAMLRPLRFVSEDAHDDPIKELRKAWVEDHPYRTAMAAGRLWRSGPHDADWLRRVGELVWSFIAATGDRRALEAMKRQIPPPRWDPELKLADVLGVLLSPEDRGEAAVDEAMARLGDYFDAVDRNDQLAESERGPLRAVIALQLARFYHGFHQRKVETSGGPRSGNTTWTVRSRSIRLRLLSWASQWSPGWEAPVALAGEIWDTSERVPDAELADVFARYVATHPEHIPALRRLHAVMREIDRGEEADKALAKLEQIAPRDPYVGAAGWRRRMDRVRKLAIDRQYDEAIHTIGEMQQRIPSTVSPFVLDLLSAAVEYRRKDTTAAERHIGQARQRGASKAAVAMLMEIHAARMKLPADVKRNFRTLREEALKQEKEPPVAAELARLVAPILVHGESYAGQVTHRRELIKYFRRCLTVKLAAWSPQAVRDVAIACVDLEDATDLPERIYSKFRRTMRREPVIQFLAGWLSEADDPMAAFEAAIEESERRPEVALPPDLIDTARREIREIQEEFRQFGHFRGGEDWIEELDPLDVIEELGDPERVGAQMDQAMEIMQTDMERARSPDELARAMKQALAPLPPVLRRLLIAQLVQQMGPSAAAFIDSYAIES